MRQVLLALVAVFGSALAAVAQTTVPTVPVNVNILVLPATGDPVTIAFVASRMTAISPTTTNCNLAPVATPTGTLVNPTTAEFDDPFHVAVAPAVQQKCRAPLPVGLANGTAYRVVAVFHDVTGAFGPRSPVGVPPFDIQAIPGLPVAPTGVGVRP